MVLKKMPRWIRWVFELGVIVLVVVAVTIWQQRDHLRGTLPMTQLTSVAQTSINLPISPDLPMLLHFSASWCPICRMDQSTIDHIAKDYPVVIVLVQMSDQDVMMWLTEHSEVSLDRVVRDDTGAILNKFGGKALPMDVVITPKAQIVTSAQGFSSEWGLRLRMWLVNF